MLWAVCRWRVGGIVVGAEILDLGWAALAFIQ